MPYWQRKKALLNSLQRYKELYSNLRALEIIIVDDGSPEPAAIGGSYPWPVSIIRMPQKTVALNPCVPFNVGVKASVGNIIAITNPEVLHLEPILVEMSAVLEDLGPTGYVAASCWDEASKRWYCHTRLCPPGQKMGRARIPDDAGFHFFAMLNRQFYESIGGFSEEYRDGQGYEDNDFLWKLQSAGAKFKICDELITHHQKCERCVWPSGGADRNKKIFEAAWPI